MSNWKEIKAITMDVDGVLTDGSLLAFDNHEMVRVFNAKDSFGIRVALLKGFYIGVFTGGDTEGVRNRFTTCGVQAEDIHMGCRGKIHDFNEFCERHALKPSEVLFIGDDVPDLPVIKAAGIGAVPADASEDAQRAADYLCEEPGGKGCVREVIENVLRAQRKWYFEDDDYEKLF
ncbi:MAG: HAD hydrolase family protein [Bacteroidales bacterium]|nr:HAD hydrolase family protein [Bacteroidales bacterium]